jgi:hypothetical protein
LTTSFLCRRCNSSLGHRYEHAARTDPTVRLLVNALRESIPGIALEMAENQAYLAIGPGDGSRTGFIKNGEFHIASSREADGSLIQTTPAARKTIAQMLRKEGYEAEFIAEALGRLDDTPENIGVELTPTLTVVKWEVTGLKMALTGSLIDPVVPLKTAFEFLALHMGGAVYERSPPLDEVRRVLSGGELNPQWVSIDRLEAPTAQPFHGIAFEGNSPHAKVQVRLFGKLAFRVHFLRVALSGPRFQYTHALDTGKEFVSATTAREQESPTSA